MAEKIQYIHTELGKGKATLAFLVEKDLGEDPIAYVAVALCSPSDQFCKRTGRLISSGRLLKNKTLFRTALTRTEGTKKQVLAALDRLSRLKKNGLPNWA